MSEGAPVALLTDFGTRDVYVGVMKGVIAGIAPGAPVIDLSHELEPFSPLAGSFALAASWHYFPHGTVFCTVVDPGVGGKRRAIAAEAVLGASRYRFVCPDNGVLTPLLDRIERVVSLEDERYRLAEVGSTFHGRDLFAPAAAHLATGVPLGRLGPDIPIEELVRLEWPRPEPTRSGWRAEVIHVDGFGNLVTNLPGERLSAHGDGWRVTAAGVAVTGPVRTFSDVEVGDLLAFTGSSGYLEIGVREGSASERLGAGKGIEVLVESS